jgi:hypothetical protein
MPRARAKRARIDEFRPPKTAAGGTGAGGTGAGGGDGRFGGLKPGQIVVCKIARHTGGGYLVLAGPDQIRGYLPTEFLHRQGEDVLAQVVALDNYRVKLLDQSVVRQPAYQYRANENLISEVIVAEPSGYLVSIIPGNRVGKMLSVVKLEPGTKVASSFACLHLGRPLINEAFDQSHELRDDYAYDFRLLVTDQLREAITVLRNGHFFEAIQKLKAILEKNGENHLALYYLGEAVFHFYGVLAAFDFYAASLSLQSEGPLADEIRSIFSDYASFLRSELIQLTLNPRAPRNLNDALNNLESEQASAYREFWIKKRRLKKGYGLVGVTLVGSTIDSTFPGTPAEKAGLQVGDRIVMVNGSCCGTSSADRIIKLLIGPIGTNVEMVVARNGKRISLTVVRSEPLGYANEYFDIEK